MAKTRIVTGSTFNQNTVNTDFTNSPSSTIFTLGEFSLTTNLDNRVIGDFSNKISTFSKDYTLETIGINKTISQKIYESDNKLKLNVDYNQITSYSRYGSVEDLLKFSIKNIVQKYPYSIYLNSQLNTGIINTITNFSYNIDTNVSTFRIPTIAINIVNNIILNSNDFIPNENNELLNFNLTKNKYVIWDYNNPEIEYSILYFSGNNITDNYITLSVTGKLFNITNTTLSKNFHIKPKKDEFNNFLFDLNDIEKYILLNRINNGFKFKLKTINNKDGRSFSDKTYVWTTSDGYNIDITGNIYTSFVNDLIKLGISYDNYKTDTIYRFYITESLKEFDITNDAKLKKLIRSYGYTFDNIKRLIDGFATLNNLTYKKENSIPDILVKNVAKVLGWNVFDIVTEDDLLSKVFTAKTENISDSLIPSDINIELWKRILVNTKWFFGSKGTRKSLETIFKLIGIPEEFIILKEYVYVVDKKLSTSEKQDSITILDDVDENFVTNPPTYNTDGYPIAVKEDKDFFFQVSGNTDGGQKYINRFRENGFNITDQVDNKKSWVYDETYQKRIDNDTIYTVNDSRLIINTKEIDFGIDASRALEFDIYQYNRFNNSPICSNGVSLNIIYLNSFTSTNENNIFEIPDIPSGDIQVILNNNVLEIDVDYIISGVDNNIVEILKDTFNRINDILTITYVVDEYINQVKYNIFKPNITQNGQLTFTLPYQPLGDVQLVVNGYTLTNNIDFNINRYNGEEVIITATINITTNDVVSIMYLNKLNPSNGTKYSDNYIVSSFFNDKLFYNNISNKYVYVTDYVIPNVNNIKVILNGKTLTNGSDFSLNQNSKKQIIFSDKIVIKINDSINTFYIIENSDGIDCINLGVDMNEISFFEYTNLIYNNLINTRNRKIITDNKGGTYPTLSKIFDLYKKNNQNKKDFNDIYSYIKKFDTHFVKFMDELLPATTILRKSGVILSNPFFGNQKYKYIRGINDGSEFISETKLYSCDLFKISSFISNDATTSVDLGSIELTVTGDNTTIGATEFSLDNEIFEKGETTSGVTTYIFENLSPSGYTIYVRDGIGCETSQVINVDKDCSLLKINSIQTTGVTSTTDLGAIQINASGDTKIMYSIDGGDNYQLNNLFKNLDEGQYDIYIKTPINCVLTDTTAIIKDCDIEISDIEFINCIAVGYISRSLTQTYDNNELNIKIKYNFVVDDNFDRHIRDTIIIKETTTDHILLQETVDFTIDAKEESTYEFKYPYSVPTYREFAFVVEYGNLIPLISCEEFTEVKPDKIVNPLPVTPPVITITGVTVSKDSCTSGFEEYITAEIRLNVKTPNRITVELEVVYVANGETNISSMSVAIEAGESIGLNGCLNNNPLDIPGLSSVTSSCITYISDQYVDLNGFDC